MQDALSRYAHSIAQGALDSHQMMSKIYGYSQTGAPMGVQLGVPVTRRRRTRRTRRTKRRTRRVKRRFRRTRRGIAGVPRSRLSVLISRVVQIGNAFAVQKSSSFGTTFALNNSGMVTCTCPATQGTHYFSLGLAFTAADIPGVSELSAMFDRYKFLSVGIRILPTTDAALAQPPGVGEASLSGWIHSAWDPDDASPFVAGTAGIDAMREVRSYRFQRMNRPWTQRVTPKILMPAYQSGVTTAYASARAPKIDWGYPDVQHYGYKLVIEILNPSGTVTNTNFRVEMQYAVMNYDPR